MTDYTKLCEELRGDFGTNVTEMCRDDKFECDELCNGMLFTNACIVLKAADAIESLQASAAEKDKRIEAWDEAWGKKCERFEAENARLRAERDAVQHGQWVEKIITTRTPEEVDVQVSIGCSICGRRYWDTPGYDIDNGEYPPYCLCGAKMDEQKGDTNANKKLHDEG